MPPGSTSARQEPPDPATDPLAGMKNMVLTPHVAFYTAEGLIRYHEECAQVVLDLLGAG